MAGGKRPHDRPSADNRVTPFPMKMAPSSAGATPVVLGNTVPEVMMIPNQKAGPAEYVLALSTITMLFLAVMPHGYL